MLLLQPYTISFFLLCVSTLGTWAASQTGCDCLGGCNLTDLCYNTECSEKNVAVGKTVVSSPLYRSQSPCLAVDGIADSDGNCVETATNDVTPFWRVDLGETYTIQHMTIYRRAAWWKRMVDLKILVGNQPCDIIDRDRAYDGSKRGKPVPISIRCNTSLTGHDVILVKNFTGTDFAYHPEILSVCEVQVWGTPTTTSLTTSPTAAASSDSNTTQATEGTSGQKTTAALPLDVIAGIVGGAVTLISAVIIVVFIVMRCRGHLRPTL